MEGVEGEGGRQKLSHKWRQDRIRGVRMCDRQIDREGRGGERQRHRETETDRQSQTDRERQRERHRQTDRQTETH